MCTRAPNHRLIARRATYNAACKWRQRGAALLIFLLITGLGGAMAMIAAFGDASSSARERRAMTVIGEAQEALIGYAVAHGRLPRPASFAESGDEAGTPCDSELRCTGYLPWRTLGLGPVYARGKPLRYSVTPAFSTPDTRWSKSVATKTIFRRSGKQLLYSLGSVNCAADNQCVPAVIVASGKYQGLSTGPNSDQVANNRAIVQFIQRPSSDDESDAGGAFDDILGWVSYPLLKNRLSFAGAWK